MSEIIYELKNGLKKQPQKHAGANHNLETVYEGKGVEQNYIQAKKWFEKAACKEVSMLNII